MNLCGGKLRSKLSAEKDAQRELEADEDESILEAPDNLDISQNEERDQPIYYFDLVQLMSLLLIPELVQLSEQHDNYLGAEDGEVDPLEVVLQSITEVFDDRTRQDILSGTTTLSTEMLTTMLEAYGDIDAASDEVLLGKMIQALGGEGTPLTIDTFRRAITDDVKSFAPKKLVGKAMGNTALHTSLFYDVFGRNWDDGEAQEAIENGPKPTDTASFIDYAADTYGSTVLHVSVWTLFLLTSECKRVTLRCHVRLYGTTPSSSPPDSLLKL